MIVAKVTSDEKLLTSQDTNYKLQMSSLKRHKYKWHDCGQSRKWWIPEVINYKWRGKVQVPDCGQSHKGWILKSQVTNDEFKKTQHTSDMIMAKAASDEFLKSQVTNDEVSYKCQIVAKVTSDELLKPQVINDELRKSQVTWLWPSLVINYLSYKLQINESLRSQVNIVNTQIKTNYKLLRQTVKV